MKLNKIKKIVVLLIMCVLLKSVTATDINFVSHTITTSVDGAESVYAIDIDSDNDIDVLSASWVDDKIAWYKNSGSETFTPYTITTSANAAHSVFAVDVNDDGDMDVLSASVIDDKIAWYENDGSETFTPHTITTSTNGPYSVFAVDVNDDGDMDILSASALDDKIAWYENNGAETFTPHTITTSADGAQSVYAIDLNDDGDMDVLSASYNDDKISWYENDGSETFTTHTITTSADGADSVFAIDLDSDGDIDVLSASYYDDEIIWYENNGVETFTLHTITTSADGANSVYAVDMDGDGDIDVLSSSENDNKITWYENNGYEVFTIHIITTSVSGAQSVFAIDVDSDGDIDVLSASYNDDKIAWYESQLGVCYDSDGVNYLYKGYVNYLNVTYWDTCSKDPPYSIPGSNDLAEMICTGGILDTDIKDCSDYGLGYICNDGKCVLSPSVNCTDSDGLNYFNKGYVLDGQYPNLTFWDDCEDNITLWEKFCGVDGIDVIDRNCNFYGSEYVCYNGMCVEQSINCTDSDGVDYYTKGYATDITTGTTYWDVCYNSITVNEYMCSGEEVDSILQDCTYSGYEPNYTCSDGKCVYTEGCSDSDLGVDYFTKGTVTLTSGLTFTDYCLAVQGNDNYVAEYYCEDGEVKLIANRQCDYDCVDGACKLITPTNPEESDLDSPWYRDGNNTLKFDRTKCEGWKSYIMCAGWKYGVKQAATGTSWVFTGIHFLYFLVFIIIIIIVGPLLVEFFKTKK